MYTMGGVCSGGTVKKNRKSVDAEHVKSSGFSGKLKSVGSFGKQKNNDDSYTYPDDFFEKAPHNLYDSGELNLSISRELKSSTPARTPANKVCFVYMNVQCAFDVFHLRLDLV